MPINNGNLIARSNVTAALDKTAKMLSGHIVGKKKYGWGNKSSSGKLIGYLDTPVWLRVHCLPKSKISETLQSSEIDANNIQGVAKPEIFTHYDWSEDETHWHATIMSFVKDSPCNEVPEIGNTFLCPETKWFHELRISLENLAMHKTNRISCRQDLINRRIWERFGKDIDTTITEWQTCHGDLHWANLTCPNLVIFDWEGWGIGPKGLDPAFLLAFSVKHPAVCNQIMAIFGDWLSEKNGRLAILFACSELLRMIELYNDHPSLKPGLIRLADQTLSFLISERQ